MSKRGVQYLCAMGKKIILVTSNTKHPAFSLKEDNLDVLYQRKLDLKRMLYYLYSEHGCERLTVQSGGTINSIFLRDHLFDAIDIVISPILVGGKNTPSLIDGASINSTAELNSLEKLKLKSCDVLNDSYIRVRYERQM